MKRLQISLEPELDRELDRVARADGVSKAEVVRRCLRNQIEPPPPLEEDPFFQIIGAFRGPGGNAAENHDDIIYGPKWSS
ncbi:MAG: CopG family transcriptional regulator [Solirubrobacterales bacterium]|nr:CopG family transcriptional regulator [Solirubrobacterales bacterium]